MRTCGYCKKEIDDEQAVRWGEALPWYVGSSKGRYVCQGCLPGYEHYQAYAEEYAADRETIRRSISQMAGDWVMGVYPDGSVGVMDIRSKTHQTIGRMLAEAGPWCVEMARQLAIDLPEIETCPQAVARAEVIKAISLWRTK